MGNVVPVGSKEFISVSRIYPVSIRDYSWINPQLGDKFLNNLPVNRCGKDFFNGEATAVRELEMLLLHFRDGPDVGSSSRKDTKNESWNLSRAVNVLALPLRGPSLTHELRSISWL